MLASRQIPMTGVSVEGSLPDGLFAAFMKYWDGIRTVHRMAMEKRINRIRYAFMAFSRCAHEAWRVNYERVYYKMFGKECQIEKMVIPGTVSGLWKGA